MYVYIYRYRYIYIYRYTYIHTHTQIQISFKSIKKDKTLKNKQKFEKTLHMKRILK